MSDTVRINGRAHSWSHVIFKYDGDQINRITSIDYSDKIERALGYGLGSHHAPVARSAGKYVPEQVKITFYLDTWNLVSDYIAQQSPTGDCLSIHSAPIFVQVAAPGLPLQTDVLSDCAVASVGNSYKEGPEILLIDIAFDVMSVSRNGKKLFDSSRGAP